MIAKSYKLLLAGAFVSLVLIWASCNSTAGSTPQSPDLPLLPVLNIVEVPATTFQEYTATIEGSKDIEIRSQVEGTLDRVFVDEGAYVRRGQSLFAINDRIYREQYNNAKASLAAAKANLLNAEIEVSKLKPLVEGNVVSDVQLNVAKGKYQVAAAQVSQAEALVRNAATNLGYTLIKAPADGYIGRIPNKTGSLVTLNAAEPLTILSENKDIHAYFSMSEKDFLQFSEKFPGNTVAEKLKNIPPVQLVLADNQVYPVKGKVQTVSGQYNSGMGSISFRASFPNTQGILRSGSTAKLRIPQTVQNAVLVPEEATFEMQDKIFVFVVSDSNKVASVPISPKGKSNSYYMVDKGLKPGQHIVYSGFDRLRDGAMIKPSPISFDSLLNQKPVGGF